MNCQKSAHDRCETLAGPFVNREEVQRVSKEDAKGNKDSGG